MQPESSSPVAKRAADKLGVPLGQVQGSGPLGKIVKSDVLAFAEVGQDAGVSMLAQMHLIRRFEEAAGSGYNRAEIGGFLHLGIGEEACIVGSVAALEQQDYLLCTYRSHGHAIARGTAPGQVMAELYGKQAGTSGGRGGSMHIYDGSRRFLGGYGIVGGNIPLAAGVALAAKASNENSAVLCQFGDGAANTGNFSETLNMAALWGLPMVFMISNNQYGMGTSLHRHAANTDLSQRGAPYSVEGSQVDGMDLEAVKQAVEQALKAARNESRPLILEALTYRFKGHSAADPEVYRPKQEVEEWKASRDPIKLYQDELIAEGRLDEKSLVAIEAAAELQVKEAEQFASEAPAPDDLMANVYQETANSLGALEQQR